MAVPVVNCLETVEVEEEQRQRGPVAPRLRQTVAQPLLEEAPVGQLGQLVVVGLFLHTRRQLPAFPQIPYDDEIRGNRQPGDDAAHQQYAQQRIRRALRGTREFGTHLRL